MGVDPRWGYGLHVTLHRSDLYVRPAEGPCSVISVQPTLLSCLKGVGKAGENSIRRHVRLTPHGLDVIKKNLHAEIISMSVSSIFLQTHFSSFAADTSFILWVQFIFNE